MTQNAAQSKGKHGKTRTMSLSPVAYNIRPLIRKFMPKSSVVFQQLFDIWPDLVTAHEAKGTIPEKLVLPRGKQSEGVLHIWAQSGSQAVEITFNKTALLRLINTAFGYALVGDLRVTAFPTAAKAPQTLAKRDSVSCQSLDKAVTGISNPQLRSALLDLGGVLPSLNLQTNPDTKTEKGQSHA